MTAALYCPDEACKHRAALHFADEEGHWGCSVSDCACSLGYEETGDLVAGRLMPPAERLLDVVSEETKGRIRGGQDVATPFFDLGSAQDVDLSNVELASGLVVAAVMVRSRLGPKPGLLFRFLRAGGDYWPDRLYVCEVAQLEDLRSLIEDNIDAARREAEAAEAAGG